MDDSQGFKHRWRAFDGLLQVQADPSLHSHLSQNKGFKGFLRAALRDDNLLGECPIRFWGQEAPGSGYSLLPGLGGRGKRHPLPVFGCVPCRQHPGGTAA